jgi:hypothetical protein
MRVFDVSGVCGATYSAASTDTAAALSSTVLTDAAGRVCKAISFSVETNSIRWAIGTPTQAGLGYVGAAGAFFRVTGEANCAAFKFISAANGVHATLQITPEY